MNKFGFIGCGKLGSAIVTGSINGGVLSAAHTVLYDKYENAAKTLEQATGARCAHDISEVCESCDVIVIVVKPADVTDLLGHIATILGELVRNKLFVSAAAGVSLEKIAFGLCTATTGSSIPVIRVMPNINAQIMCSTTAICPNASATPEHVSDITALFNAIGKAFVITEDKLDLFTSIAACMPAYALLFADAAAQAAVMLGMNKTQALEIIAHSITGTMRTLTETGNHPRELIDAVCSPGGITVKGLAAMQKGGLEYAVIEGIHAAAGKKLPS